MITRNAKKFPEKVAVVSEGLSLTYRELNERVNRLANTLIEKGLKKGDRIGVLVPRCHPFVEIYFAAAKTGGIFCPYNNHFNAREVNDIIAYSTPRFLFLDADFGDMVDSLRSHLESVEHFVCLQKPKWSFMGDYESLISEGRKSDPGINIEDDDVMSIFFTAGTTGRPKGAMRTHRHVVTNAITGVIELKVTYHERALISFPMYHVACEDNMGRHFFMPNTLVIKREGPLIPKRCWNFSPRKKLRCVNSSLP